MVKPRIRILWWYHNPHEMGIMLELKTPESDIPMYGESIRQICKLYKYRLQKIGMYKILAQKKKKTTCKSTE